MNRPDPPGFPRILLDLHPQPPDGLLQFAATTRRLVCGNQALLLARGIGSIHVDARFAKPVDETLLRAQADEGVRIFFTWEDAILAGGFGEAVEDCLTNHPAHPSVVRFGWPDCFVQHATTRVDLLRRHHLTPEDALEAILRALP